MSKARPVERAALLEDDHRRPRSRRAARRRPRRPAPEPTTQTSGRSSTSAPISWPRMSALAAVPRYVPPTSGGARVAHRAPRGRRGPVGGGDQPAQRAEAGPPERERGSSTTPRAARPGPPGRPRGSGLGEPSSSQPEQGGVEEREEPLHVALDPRVAHREEGVDALRDADPSRGRGSGGRREGPPRDRQEDGGLGGRGPRRGQPPLSGHRPAAGATRASPPPPGAPRRRDPPAMKRRRP